MRIGVLTGGGDCPGLNAAIRAVVKHAEIGHGHSVIGFKRGWRGVAEGDFTPILRDDVRNALTLGGTMLGTDRFHPDENPGATEQVLQVLKDEAVTALVCIGGDGTLTAAAKVAEQGVNVIGIPKTIDNDVWLTERSIGFDTALWVATEAIDRLHTTAESHHRVMVLEVMGREAGWIAINSGIAGGADVIITPEEPFDIEKVVSRIRHRHKAHAKYSIVVVAEGATPAPGTALEFSGAKESMLTGKTSELIADAIASLTGFDTRLTVLGHVQRGGIPTPFDRILGSRFGVAAVDALSDGKTNMVTTLQSGRIVLEPFSKIAGKQQKVPKELLKVARSLL
ncbi:MAG: 6-phosphofructokinase [Bifidobacteriaceae bacterium]|jgi:6-phosphofructokinase 1|nr:6-phosphofructokinase [Bifidobacteriaceae bacterium]